MELSQLSLSALLLCGIPFGIMLNITYCLTEIPDSNSRIVAGLFVHIKDFLYMILTGIATVLLVYYVNNGEFRYLVLVGTLIGYMLSNLLLRKMIIRFRNLTLHVFDIIIITPVKKYCMLPFGPIVSKVAQSRTESRKKYMMQLASNGFENYTEAEE